MIPQVEVLRLLRVSRQLSAMTHNGGPGGQVWTEFYYTITSKASPLLHSLTGSRGKCIGNKKSEAGRLTLIKKERKGHVTF